ncbi:glycosyltransferase family 1 protein [Pullulanibacillus sp. KACC 23026]|uniref:glycosyltransferase family 1 protein n=1 Tax=Pullulanibacillus sp. KACC 23026 TaxID=3028315 RepID=UPI0023AF63E9|nr:glycosyltransferase family 1 protein [Pullulanibacillus sp. KACC 23026]WEG13387.1 glycosyltransferase family 1 protein [Pullulanibacillus sp. KACC 23026]
MKKVKILVIPTGGMGLDGITTSVLNYYRNFDRNKIHTTFIATKIKCDDKLFINISREIANNGDSIYYINRSKNVFVYFVELIRLMYKGKYDLVHIHGSSSLMSIELLAAKLSGIEVRIAHSHNTTCEHKLINKLLYPFFLFLTTYRVACGIDAGRWLFKKHDFTVIRNGIDFRDFKFDKEKRKKVRAELGIENKRVIGHIGSFNTQKNHSFLIDIFNEIVKLDEDSVLVLIGDGKKRSEIEEKASKFLFKKNILFLGHRNDVADLLNAMDLMILPSLYEGLPLVLVEWQAMGIISLISDRITKEIAVTDLVNYEPLESGSSKWARKALDLLDKKKPSTDYPSLEEYEISCNVRKLMSLYYELVSC